MSASKFKLTDISLTRATELFLTEVRSGRERSVDDYAQAFPHLASEIRASFPTVIALERAAVPAPRSPSIVSKTILGGCEVIAELGRGAMGIVYAAHQNELGRRVAVKVIPIQGTDAARLIDRFELERRAMARLEHPNIVPVFSYGHDEKHAFLVMKLIEGKSLHQLLDGNLDYRSQILFSSLQDDWRELAKLGADVASGLQHAHDQGLIHRDIKPANLLMDQQGKVWITDFGLAKVYDYARSLSLTGEAIGTPRYMAPEQLRGVCDPRSDVYSLGITLYELAAKERAWNDQNLISLTVERASLDLPDIREKNPTIPDHLARIIMKACAFAPDDRYLSAKELQVVLERFMNGVTPSDRRRRKREPDAVFRKKSRRLKLLTLATMPIFIFGFAHLITKLKKKDVTAQHLSAPEVTPVARKSTSNFIEQLADSKEEDLGVVVSEFIREAVVESGDELHLKDEEKNLIVAQVDSVVSKIRDRNKERYEANEKTFHEVYHDSTLPISTKVISLVHVIDRSGLSDKAKKVAHADLTRFAKSVVNRYITAAEATRMIEDLTNGKVYSAAELGSVSISDRKIQSWLVSLQRRLSTLPRAAYEQLNIDGELQRAVDQSMGQVENH